MQLKHLLFPAFLFCSLAASSQFKKGTRMIGATIGSGTVTSATTDYTYPTAPGYSADHSNFSLSLSPSYGVFINSNTVLGVSLLVNTSRQKTNNRSLSDTIFSSSTATNTDLGIGGFVRYYLNTTKSIAPFLQAYLNGGTGFGKTSGFAFGNDGFGAYKDNYSGDSRGRFFFNTGLNLGLTKMLNPHVGLDAYVGYAFSYSKVETRTTSVRDYTSGPDITQQFEPAQKYTGNGVLIGIGLQVFLERK